jgi:hypothetical protein
VAAMTNTPPFLPPPGRSGGDEGLVRAAVLALGGGGREVAGQARGAGLDGRRVTEHHLAASALDHLVGNDNQEVDHGHEDDEVDDGGDESAEIHQGLGVAGPDLHAQAVLAALEALDEVVKAVIRALNARATTKPTATTITSPRIRKFLNPLMYCSPIGMGDD